MRTVVVLAGGLGTRVQDLTQGQLAKAMIPIAGKPFVHHKLAEVERLGADRAVMLLGHKSEQIVSYVDKLRSDWRLDIDVVDDGPQLLGTGGSIKAAAHLLPDRFWITYGDTLLDVDLHAAERRCVDLASDGVMTVLHNRDRWEPSNVRVLGNVVEEYSKVPTPKRAEHIDYGYMYINRASIGQVPRESFDLFDVLQPMIRQRKLGAFEAHARFHDVGTPEAVKSTERWLLSRQ